jgi:hypothetical protein
MTDDRISRGLRAANQFTGAPYEPVGEPGSVESVIATIATGDAGDELWKLNHYYSRINDPDAEDAEEAEWELHNLTVDPEERRNLAGAGLPQLFEMRGLLDATRAACRRSPLVTNHTEVGS